MFHSHHLSTFSVICLSSLLPLSGLYFSCLPIGLCLFLFIYPSVFSLFLKLPQCLSLPLFCLLFTVMSLRPSVLLSKFSLLFSFLPLFLCLSVLLCSRLLLAQMVKNLPAKQDTQSQSLGWEDPLEKEMATHSSILAWKIPWTEEPGRLQSMVSRVGHN